MAALVNTCDLLQTWPRLLVGFSYVYLSSSFGHIYSSLQVCSRPAIRQDIMPMSRRGHTQTPRCPSNLQPRLWEAAHRHRNLAGPQPGRCSRFAARHVPPAREDGLLVIDFQARFNDAFRASKMGFGRKTKGGKEELKQRLSADLAGFQKDMCCDLLLFRHAWARLFSNIGAYMLLHRRLRKT